MQAGKVSVALRNSGDNCDCCVEITSVSEVSLWLLNKIFDRQKWLELQQQLQLTSVNVRTC